MRRHPQACKGIYAQQQHRKCDTPGKGNLVRRITNQPDGHRPQHVGQRWIGGFNADYAQDACKGTRSIFQKKCIIKCFRTLNMMGFITIHGMMICVQPIDVYSDMKQEQHNSGNIGPAAVSVLWGRGRLRR